MQDNKEKKFQYILQIHIMCANADMQKEINLFHVTWKNTRI